jgi:hypothetical protein
MLQTLVVPHAEAFGVLAMRIEFFAGAILLVTEARGRAAAAGQTARSMVTSRWRPWSAPPPRSCWVQCR